MHLKVIFTHTISQEKPTFYDINNKMDYQTNNLLNNLNQNIYRSVLMSNCIIQGNKTFSKNR